MPKIEANEILINYELSPVDDSSNDLLVLINGLADDLHTWDPQVPAFLEAKYRVLRYDNRGIGETSAPEGPYTAELLADDLHALLHALSRDLCAQRFHLLGISMGGMIAQAYALKYANGSAASEGLELLSLSLCCTYAEPTTFCGRMFELWADMAQKMSVRDVMRDVCLWCFSVPFFRQRTADLEEVEAALGASDLSTEAYLSQLNVIQRFDTTSALEALKAEGKGLGALEGRKVMVLAGRTDILIPVVLSRELAERIEGSQFVTCKGGHGCSLEFPDDFNKVVVAFLDEHRAHKP